MSLDAVGITLVAVNLIICFSGAIALALYLRNATRIFRGLLRYSFNLIALYFIECVGLATWMGMPVFSVGFAFIWGFVLGRWLRSQTSPRQALKTSFLISIYSSLPAASLILIPMVTAIGGWNITSAADGLRMGIPQFLPAPVDTILGFYALLAIGAVVFKLIITTGIASILILLYSDRTIG